MASCNFTLPGIPPTPHQPATCIFAFPMRKFGQKKVVECSFRAEWFESCPWLHYLEGPDVVLRLFCVKALKDFTIELHNCDASFVSVQS